MTTEIAVILDVNTRPTWISGPPPAIQGNYKPTSEGFLPATEQVSALSGSQVNNLKVIFSDIEKYADVKFVYLTAGQIPSENQIRISAFNFANSTISASARSFWELDASANPTNNRAFAYNMIEKYSSLHNGSSTWASWETYHEIFQHVLGLKPDTGLNDSNIINTTIGNYPIVVNGLPDDSQNLIPYGLTIKDRLDLVAQFGEKSDQSFIPTIYFDKTTSKYITRMFGKDSSLNNQNSFNLKCTISNSNLADAKSVLFDGNVLTINNAVIELAKGSNVKTVTGDGNTLNLRNGQSVTTNGTFTVTCEGGAPRTITGTYKAECDAGVLKLSGVTENNTSTSNGKITSNLFTYTNNAVSFNSNANVNNVIGIDAALAASNRIGNISTEFYNTLTKAAAEYYLPAAPGVVQPNYNIAPNFNPIGAFYETVSPANDNALSIAAKTAVLLGTGNLSTTASALAARDANADGKLTGAELNGLNAWADLNENGQIDSGELTNAAQASMGANVGQLNSIDYTFYTQGNGKPLAGVASTPSLSAAYIAPVLSTPASNYRTLRDTDNSYIAVYSSIIYPIKWTANQVKVNYNNKTYLIGTDGNDNFDANYYSSTPSYIIDSSKLVNFLAGGGDDQMGGSSRADNLWGGTGNDALWGYAGDDNLYGEEGDDHIQGDDGNDRLVGGAGNDALLGGTGNDTVSGGDGNDELQGNEGNDLLTGEAGNDKLFGQVGDDTLWGGDGDDILVGFTASNEAKQTLSAGETDNDILIGGAGSDLLLGGLGNDRLEGGTGNDELSGDAGNDQLTGDAGDDRLFGGAGDDQLWGGDGADVILGFTASNDAKQTLSAGETDNDRIYAGAGNDYVLAGLGDDQVYGEAGDDELQGNEGNDILSGGDGNDRLFGQVGDDTLYGGEGDDILLGFTASNESKQTLSAGESDNDKLYGGAGHDTLIGGLGNDYLDGGAGADIMDGGAGDDTYIVNSVNDVIYEKENAGYDTVISSTNYLLNNGIEELRLLEGFNIHGTGNALDNKIIGNSADNIIDGVTGADNMIGGLGNDTYYVDNVGDQVIENANEGTDKVQSSISYTLSANLEHLNLLDFSKPELGLVDGTRSLVYGYPKRNELDYMQGNAVQGYEGTCALTSIANLINQSGVPATEGEVVRRAIDNQWAVTDITKPSWERGGSNYLGQQALLDSYAIRNNLLAGYNENGIANLMRSGRGVIVAVDAGVLWGDSHYSTGQVNHVVTLTGAVYKESDGTLLGFYITDSGRGLVSDMTRFVGIELFRQSANVASAYAIYTIEPLKLWDENINGTGNAGDNVLTGNRGDNALYGLAGNDTLEGGAGNDTLDGGAGADAMTGGAGDDVYVVDNAGDTVTESAGEGLDSVRASINFNLGTNLENLTLTGTDNLSATGNALDNELMGNSGNNTLTGGAGNDVLDGGTGADAMVGGTGNDIYRVDNVADSITENADEGTDRVESSVTYTLAANVENLMLTSSANIDGTGNALNNEIIGNSGNNNLAGGAGNDVLTGGAGNDILDGGVGNDTYRVGAGFGLDSIRDNDATAGNLDKVLFDQSVSAKQISVLRSGNDLLLRQDANNTLTLENWYVSDANKVELVQFADGTSWDVAQLKAMSNFAPTGSVSLTGEIAQGQTLTASNTLADADGLGTVSYRWQTSANNGATWTDVAGVSGNSLTLASEQVGKQVRALASYTDGRGTLESIASQATELVYVQSNHAPTGSVTLSGTAAQNQVLTATNALADADGLGAIGYRWQSTLDNGATWTDIAGATNNTFTLSQAEVDKQIRSVARYTDGKGSVEDVASNVTSAVANVNDAATGTVTLNGSATQNQVLSVNTNTLADADGLGALNYQWQASSDNGSTWANITGATSSAFALTQAQVGKKVRAAVSYTDGYGQAESVNTSATNAVANVNDAPVGTVTLSGSMARGQTLQTNVSGLSDADGLGALSYQWQVTSDNGITWGNIANATASSYTLAAAQVGKKVRVMTSYTDGQGTLETVTGVASSVIGIPVSDIAGVTGTEYLVGTSGDDVISAIDGVNVLNGLDGNDTYTGGVGNDVFMIKNKPGAVDTITNFAVGTDRLLLTGFKTKPTFTAEGNNTRVNLDAGQSILLQGVNASLMNEATYSQVESVDFGGASVLSLNFLSSSSNGVVSGGDQPDWIFDQSGSNTLSGDSNNLSTTGGNDIIDGGAGNDLILGGAGNDQLRGGGGYDYIQGDAGNDVIYLEGDALLSFNVNAGDGSNLSGFGFNSMTFGSNTVRPYVYGNAGSDQFVLDQNTNGYMLQNTIMDFELGTVGAPIDKIDLSHVSQARQFSDLSLARVTVNGAVFTQIKVSGDALNRVVTLYGDYKNLLRAEHFNFSTLNRAATGSVTLSGTVAQNEVLTANAASLADADGLGALNYQWQISSDNGATWSSIGGATSSTFALGQSHVGKQLRNVVSFTDGQGVKETVISSATATVANVNDAPTGTLVMSGVAVEGRVLSVSSNTLADADGLGVVNYRWQVSADNGSTWSDISGATASTFALKQAQVGKQVRAVASYIDGQGTTENVSSVATTISNVNDAPTGSVTISGTATQNEVLTASNNLADNDGLGAVGYQWQSSADNGVTWTNIGGATAATFALTEAQVGKQVRAVASYIDGQNTTETVSSGASVVVANVNDAPTGAVAISGTTTQNQVLTAINNLVDADGLGALNYQWQSSSDNGVTWTNISGATGVNFTLSEAQVGKIVRTITSYTDGHGTAESITSDATVTISNINDAPTGSVTISGTSTQNQVLTASNNLADTDGLGAIGYQWQSSADNGVTWTNISGATDVTFTLSEALVGKQVRAVASYIDGQSKTETVSSVATTVANVNDAPTGLVTISGTAAQKQVLTANLSLADADGLGVLSYQWQASADNGVTWTNINGATGANFKLSEAQVGKAVRAVTSYTDGHGTTESVISSATDVIANVNDAATGAVIVSGLAAQNQVLTASNNLADADGLGTVAYQWQSSADNGVTWTNISGATDVTFTLSEAQVDKQVRAIASYTDGHGTTETVGSRATSAIANINDALTGGVSISGNATQNQILSASNTLADADGLGAVSYQWQTSTDGATWSNINGANASSFTLSQAQVGKQVRAKASYIDGHGSVESAVSGSTTAISNVNDAPTGNVSLSGIATQGQTMTASVDNLFDADGLGIVSYQWQMSLDGTTWAAITGATDSAFTLTQAQVGRKVRAVASYTDGQGTAESVASTSTTNVASGLNDVLGTSGNDVLSGTVRADYLQGFAGNDVLNGSLGADKLDGGAGIDTADYSGVVLSNANNQGIVANLATGLLTKVQADVLSRASSLTTTVTNIVSANRVVDLDVESMSLTMRGAWIAGGASLAGKPLFVDRSVAGQVTYWSACLDGSMTKAVQVQLKDTADGISVQLLQAKYTNGNRLDGSFNFNTQGIAAPVANSITGAGYGVASFGVKLRSDQLTGIENLTGTAYNDTITGDANANVLSGGAGNDVLNGSLGIDKLDGGAAVDTADYSGVLLSNANNQGIVANLATGLLTKVQADVLSRASSLTTTVTNIVNANRVVDLDVESMSLTMRGAWIAGGASLAGKPLFVDRSVAGQVTYWAACLDGSMTKAVQVQLKDTADGVSVQLLQAKYTNGNRLDGSFNFNTQGTVAPVANSITGAGYGVASFGVKLRSDQLTGIENLTGTSYNDTMTGDANANVLSGGAGNDIQQGLAGDDTLTDATGNNLLDGGLGNDTIVGGAGNELIVGGKGNDTITTGTGYDVIAFNKGDGQDIINASTVADNTLSLGGNFAYSDLSLSKAGNDLLLKMGATDQITLKDWYAATANHSIVNLQVIAEAMQGFSLGGSDQLRNNKVESFNFANLVSTFDAEGAVANWQLTDARLTMHLKAGSDVAAIGGDLAYQYGKNSSLAGVGMLAAQNVINSASMGQSAQTLNNPSVWQAELVKLG